MFNYNKNAYLTKKINRCALCRKQCELSFEHIPPKSAYNSTPAKPIVGLDLLSKPDRLPWEIKGLPYENMQQGIGLYSLCKSCNNLTGHWYGSAYAALAKRIVELSKTDLDPKCESIEIQGLYPLRIIKQVISMFCSINPNIKMDDLRNFVLNKEYVGIDKTKYKLCMYFTQSDVKRFWGNACKWAYRNWNELFAK